MRVTIRKIAEIAKVSRGSVDKVLNDRPGVSNETRRKIQEIVNTLDYKPNIVGKSLNNHKNPISIGVIMPPEENPFFNDIKNGMDSAYNEYKDFGIKVDYKFMKSLDAEEQYDLIKQFKDDNINGIALAAIDNDIIRDAINKLVESQIPVVTFNSDILGTKRMCFVGQDLVKSGRVAAELMVKLLGDKGRIAIITGSYKILAHNQRIEGFKNFLKETESNIEIVEIIENKDKDTLSFEHTLSLLERNKDLNGIFFTGGGVSGAGKALKLSKITDVRDRIKVITFDFVPGTVELVKNGIIDFTIGQEPYEQGYRTLKILSDYLLSGNIPKTEHVQTKIDIRIEGNIDM